MADETEAPLGAKEIEEIWTLFAQEGHEALDQVEQTLLELERRPTDAPRIAELFRALHSFKGGARLMGLERLEGVAHQAEDLVAPVRDEGRPFTPAMLEVLLATRDSLRRMLDYAVTHRADVPADLAAPVQARLQVALDNSAAPSEPAPGPKSEPEPAPPPAALAELPPVIPSQDPGYLRAFLEIAQEQLENLQMALGQVAENPGEAGPAIAAVAEALMLAAERMGYARLLSMAEKLKTTGAAATRTSLPALQAIELDIFGELAAIQETALASATAAEQPGDIDLTWVFRHWHAERVFRYLSELAGLVDECQAGIPPEQFRQRADETIRLLRGVYQACLFYGLEQAARLSLTVEDLCARVVQGELKPGPALLEAHRLVVTRLTPLLEAARAGEELVQENLADAQTQVQAVLYHELALPPGQDVWAVLDIPDDFKPALTAESLAALSLARSAGERVFTLLVDLEHLPGQGEALFQWAQGDMARMITNINAPSGGAAAYYLLLVTAQPWEGVLKSLKTLDPTGRYITPRLCGLRSPAALVAEAVLAEAALAGTAAPAPAVKPAPAPAGRRSTVSEDALTGLLEIVGKLLASYATLQKVVEHLQENTVADLGLRFARRAEVAEADRTQYEAQVLVWNDHLQRLAQVEAELGPLLERLQDQTLTLRNRPVAGLLDTARASTQALARRLGKQLRVELSGEDLMLAQGLLATLYGPLIQLAELAVLHSLETPAQREAAGKPAEGLLRIAVSKRDAYVQAVIEDDGQGLHGDALLARAQRLSGQAEVAPAEVARLALTPEMGPIDGVVLSDAQATLAARHGELSLTYTPGQGLRSVLRLMLDTVIIDGMVVRVGKVRYVIPLPVIRRIVKPTESEVVHAAASGGGWLLRLGETLAPVEGLRGPVTEPAAGLLVVVENADRLVALAVDELLGQQAVLVQPLQGYLAGVPHVSGSALLGDGQVGFVLKMT